MTKKHLILLLLGVVPVLAAVPTSNLGGRVVLDVVKAIFPAPVDRPALKAWKSSRKDAPLERRPDPNGPLVARAFRTFYDPFAGMLTYVRVFSGKIAAAADIFNSTENTSDRPSHMYFPLGGVIISRKIHQAILGAPADQKFMHAATYSGHPACCAVGLRNVEIMEQENLVERAAVMGRRLLAGLEGLRDLPNVGDVRGLGMMCGVELVEKKETRAPAIGLGARVAKEALGRGLIFRLRGGGAEPAIGDTICIAPPLSTPPETLDRIVDILRASITAAAA